MLIQIIQRTPLWVWLIFAVLLALGIMYSKTRVVSRPRLIIVPLVMLGLSFSGVLQAFGAGMWPIGAWLLALLATVLLSLKFAQIKYAHYIADSQQFSLPGSWLPLGLMMCIFALKYGVGVMQGMRVPLAAALEFSILISAAYGLLSGAFFARALLVWRTKNTR